MARFSYSLFTAVSFAALFWQCELALADARVAFFFDIGHSYVAKNNCKDIEIVDGGIDKAARSKNLEPGIGEVARKAMLYLASDGKFGEKTNDDDMKSITASLLLFATDSKQIGIEAWCSFRVPKLIDAGYVVQSKKSELEQINDGLDRQFIEMKKAMPIQVSKLSMLTNVSRNGTAITYSIEDKLVASNVSEQGKQKLLSDATANVCKNENSRLLLDKGYSFSSIHFDQGGLFIAQIYIDRSKCN